MKKQIWTKSLALQVIYEYLVNYAPLTDKTKSAIENAVSLKLYKKGQYLMHAGAKGDKLFFILEGFVRVFTDEQNKQGSGNREISKWFLMPGDVAVSPLSFFQNIISEESMIAEEDTVVVMLEASALHKLCIDHPDFLWHRTRITEKYYCIEVHQRNAIQNKTAAQSYDYLAKHFPLLLQRVSAKHLAGYLGVNETYISDLRAKNTRRK